MGCKTQGLLRCLASLAHPVNESTKKSLKDKLAANHVRHERERFLATLPAHLATPLASAPFLTPPESTPILSRLYISEEGLGNSEHIVPVGYTYQAFSWPDPLLAVADSFPDTYDLQPAFVHPFGDLPLFCVPFGWARTQFRALFAFSPRGLAAITESLQIGLVTDHYIGCLDDVPTDNEKVYELAFWHPTANA